MKNSKLWRAFSILTSTELKQFAWFLDSPYHNRRSDTTALFQALKACRNSQLPCEKSALWNWVHPGLPWSDSEFRHLSRYLLALLEEFLAVNQSRKSETLPISTAKIYNDRGLQDMASSLARKTAKKLHRSTPLSAPDLLDAFALEQILFQAHDPEKRSFTPGLQGMSDALDRWFIVQKLRLACTMSSQQKVFQAEYQLGMLDEALELAKQRPWCEEPLIALYERTYAMVWGQDPAAAYRQQVELLATHSELLSREEQRSLSLMSINFCIRQLNQGLGEYLPEVYLLYKRGLDERWLFENGQLSPWTYRNIVSAGLKLQDFDWVDEFIEHYRDEVPEAFRFTFYQCNRAELQLAQGRFREVLRTLRFVQIKDPLTQLRARLLLIKASHGLGEFGFLESQLENLRRLLSRKKQLAYHREAYRNFERFLRRLIALAPDADRGAFIAELLQMEIVAEKDWLIAAAQKT